LPEFKDDSNACPAEAYDFAGGDLLSRAVCLEEAKQFGRAWWAYHEILSRISPKEKSWEIANAYIGQLGQRAPNKLTIVVPPEVAGLDRIEIQLNGQHLEREFWGKPVPVDVGVAVVTIVAPGRECQETSVEVTDGEPPTITIQMPNERKSSPPTPPERQPLPATAPVVAPPAPPLVPTRSMSAVTIGGIASVGIGSAALILGGVAWYLGDKKESSLKQASPESCTGTCADNHNNDVDKYNQWKTLNWVGYVVGGVGVGAGILCLSLGSSSAKDSTRTSIYTDGLSAGVRGKF
jgi:hypothetical protein